MKMLMMRSHIWLEILFRIEYFICNVDQSISSIETRFEKFLQYETIFGFFYLKLKILNR